MKKTCVDRYGSIQVRKVYSNHCFQCFAQKKWLCCFSPLLKLSIMCFWQAQAKIFLFPPCWSKICVWKNKAWKKTVALIISIKSWFKASLQKFDFAQRFFWGKKLKPLITRRLKNTKGYYVMEPSGLDIQFLPLHR